MTQTALISAGPLDDDPVADVPDGLTNLLSAYLSVTADASTLMSEPAIDLSLIPTLANDLAVAKVDADDWLTDHSNEAILGATAVSGYANYLAAIAPKLATAAQAVDAGGDPASLRSMIGRLEGMVTLQQSAIGSAVLSTGDVILAVKQDQARFDTTATTIASTYTAELNALQQRFDADQAMLKQLNDDFNLAVVKLVAAGVGMGIAAGAAVIDTSVGKTIAQKSFEIGKDAYSGASADLEKMNATIQDMAEVFADIAEDKAEIALFASIRAVVGRLSSTGQGFVAALSAMSTAWNAELSRLQTITVTASAKPPSGLALLVEDLQQLWMKIGADAQQLVVDVPHLAARCEAADS